MHGGYRWLTSGTAIISALLIVSCENDSPAQPTPLPPLPPPPVSLARVDIRAPAAVDLQQSTQLTATAVRSDGSSEDVTSQAQWSSSNSSTIRVSASGEATALRAGEVTISARFQNRTGTTALAALPPGTFKLSGTVTEEGRPLDLVTVSVVSGVGAGLATVSGNGGRYSLFGVAGHVSLQAKRDGYRNLNQDFDVAGHTTHNVEMLPVRERVRVAGTYTLTITANCDSSGFKLPESVRRRSYTATVQQDGPDLAMTLSDADLVISSEGRNRFEGSLDVADNVSFDFGSYFFSYYYYYYYAPISVTGLVERVSPTTMLLISGSVRARASSSSIIGNLNGAVILREGTTTGYCGSGFHTFEMRRR